MLPQIILFLKEYKDTILGILSIVALCYAIISDKKVNKILNKIDAQIINISGISKNLSLISDNLSYISTNLTDISENLSTRYVGNFPDNMNEITQLISRTKRKLTILSDVPAYGQYSNPEDFSKYSLAINELLLPLNNIQVHIISGSKAIRTMSRSVQFRNRSFEEIEKSDKYIKYFKVFKQIAPPKTKDIGGFFEWIDERNRHFEEDFKDKGAYIFEMPNEISSHIWLSDDREAIFTFYNSLQDSNEVSFYTKDKRIIDILLTVIKDTELKRKQI